MGKMSELDLTLKELRESATKIISLVDDLYSLFSSKPTEEESPKEEKKKLTLEKLEPCLQLKVVMVIQLRLKHYLRALVLINYLKLKKKTMKIYIFKPR